MAARKALMERLQVAKIVEIPCYSFELADGKHERLDFIPVDNAPGFTHRVAHNGVLTRVHLGNHVALSQTVALDILDIVRTRAAEGTLYGHEQGKLRVQAPDLDERFKAGV